LMQKCMYVCVFCNCNCNRRLHLGGEKKQQHPADYDSTYFLMIDIYDRID
jgi:hypothetical protein